jgi:hypothetical protein
MCDYRCRPTTIPPLVCRENEGALTPRIQCQGVDVQSRPCSYVVCEPIDTQLFTHKSLRLKIHSPDRFLCNWFRQFRIRTSAQMGPHEEQSGQRSQTHASKRLAIEETFQPHLISPTIRSLNIGD